jgi:hypothetical protein
MAYTVHQAKTHFSRLLKEADAGPEVIVLSGSMLDGKLLTKLDIPAPESRSN